MIYRGTYSRFAPVSMLLAASVLLSACGGGGGGGSDGGSSGDADLADLSGIIDIAADTRVDRDYADLWQANDSGWQGITRNDSPETAQLLPVPAVVSGYLSASPGTYDNGLVFPDDGLDYYHAPLEPDDNVFLQVFPATDGSPENIGLSVTIDGQELCQNGVCTQAEGYGMSLPRSLAEGDSEIRIAVTGGEPVRYVLTLAPLGGVLSSNAAWPEPALAVNEAIVTMDQVTVQSSSATALGQRPDVQVLRSIGPRTLHLRRPETAMAQSASGSAESDPRQATVDWIRELRAETGAVVEPNYLFRLLATDPASNVPGYSNPDNRWNLDMIRMAEAWGLTVNSGAGTGVGVAVMDTGLFSPTPGSYGPWHDDLDTNVIGQSQVEQLDFVSRDYDVDSSPGRDVNPATPPTPGSAMTSFHGTHVGGIIAAEDNTSGTVGVADDSTLFPYRVLGVNKDTGEDGSGTVADLVDAINAAVARNDIDVINLSLGGLPDLNSLKQATDAALAQGILVVAAGGNSGNASAVYPAANRGVVGVGAVSLSGALASYSNFGQSVDLVAPGGDVGSGADGIYNAWCDVAGSDAICGADNVDSWSSGYAYLAGTSMAAPHVTGVYALMHRLAEGSGVPMAQDRFRALMIDGRLTTTVDPLLNYDLAVHGAGLLDAYLSLEATLSGDFPTVVSAHPRVLFLDADARDVPVALEILSPTVSSGLDITGTVSVPDWITVTDANGNALAASQSLPSGLTLSVNESALPSGRLATGLVTIPYGTDNRVLNIPVTVQVPDDTVDRAAGRHYVLLIDIDDSGDDNSRQLVSTVQSGQYPFSFNDVEPGQYLLVAGTDLDNNGIICENGEACAEYPVTGSPQPISVGDNGISGLDMTTSFQRPTLAEMGLPRYGFEGYRIPEGGSPSSGNNPAKEVSLP
ncbi:serine protease [Marinobacter daqiaonensis]|uniref:Serine protease n=1 Tax=Marinobacter daqiaonensis TaxID=650891 RepID=A0A1I6HE52_9GAMM|nr:S8 family serine peptidase [Marinobacter daqiaonensis]SFR52763.1 serine protease [Marinobacter daqiaonensis]